MSSRRQQLKEVRSQPTPEAIVAELPAKSPYRKEIIRVFLPFNCVLGEI